MNSAFASRILTYIRSSRPEGSCDAFLSHPRRDYRDRFCVPLGVVMEHRFAFAYWIKFKQQLMYDVRTHKARSDEQFTPPDLISFDWHDDFGSPRDFKEVDLLTLDQKDAGEVTLFAWAALRHLNDGHILPAVWLNALGNVYIVQKQYRDYSQRSKRVVDRFGRLHEIHFIPSLRRLASVFDKTNTGTGVFWDIDLDFFVYLNNSDLSKSRPFENRKIRELLNPRRSWMKPVLHDLKGITLALEPRYTGGLTQSLRIFSQWERTLFDGSVFNQRCRWKKAVSAVAAVR